jgi:hypothetical protein
MDCLFLGFEWYQWCNRTKDFFPGFKEKCKKLEVSNTCSKIEHFFTVHMKGKIYAPKQGRIVIFSAEMCNLNKNNNSTCPNQVGPTRNKIEAKGAI